MKAIKFGKLKIGAYFYHVDGDKVAGVETGDTKIEPTPPKNGKKFGCGCSKCAFNTHSTGHTCDNTTVFVKE
jgi:hypothetical protein